MSEYETIKKPETVNVFIGTLATGVYRKLLKNNNDKLPSWVGNCVFDGHVGEGITKLDFSKVKRVLGPEKELVKKKYTICIPELNKEEIDNVFDAEGSLTNRSIGNILRFCVGKTLNDHTVDVSTRISDECTAIRTAAENRHESSNISQDKLFNVIASSGGGSGSSIILPYIATIKNQIPDCKVNMIVPLLIRGQSSKMEPSITIKNNIKGIIADVIEYVTISKELDVNGKGLEFRGHHDPIDDTPIKIPYRVADNIFWLYGFKSIEDFTDNTAQFIDDLSAGIPYSLEQADNNFIKGVKENGIILCMAKYTFSKENAVEYIRVESFKNQLREYIEDYDDKGKGQNQIIEEMTLKEIIDSKMEDSKIINVEKEGQIRRFDINDLPEIEDMISEIDINDSNKKTKIDIISEKYDKDIDKLVYKIKEKTEEMLEDGRLKETSIRSKDSITYIIYEIKKKINSISNEDIEKIKKEITELGFLLKDELERDGWFKNRRNKSKIRNSASDIILKLRELEDKKRQKALNDIKTKKLTEISIYWTDRNVKIKKFLEKKDNLYKITLKQPQTDMIKMDDLLIKSSSTFKLPRDVDEGSFKQVNLDFDKVEEKFFEKHKEIDDKAKKSWVINLPELLNDVKNPEEAYISHDKITDKKNIIVAIVPEFANVVDADGFDYVVKRDYWGVVIYRFLLNVSPHEIFLGINDGKLEVDKYKSRPFAPQSAPKVGNENTAP